MLPYSPSLRTAVSLAIVGGRVTICRRSSAGSPCSGWNSSRPSAAASSTRSSSLSQPGAEVSCCSAWKATRRRFVARSWSKHRQVSCRALRSSRTAGTCGRFVMRPP
ncbi:hypothetical protein ACFQ1I_08125 [Kitasatospora arboriphila]